MKTTIFPESQTIKTEPEFHKQVIRALNLVLAGLYVVVILLLLSAPVQHGNRGMGGEMEHGGNAGMGNAANVSLPVMYIFFSLLVILHLVMLFKSLSWHLIMSVGLGLIISSTLILCLLFFVRPYANLLQFTYPLPLLVYGSLGLSFILGMYGVTELVRNRHQFEGSEITLTPSPFPLPTNRYRNVRILAEGGVGIIWYAERISDNLAVVVKVPRRVDEKTGMSFMQEISVWKDLDHPHIAAVLSANILPVPYIEIEYLPGTLADIKKPVATAKALQIIRSLVSALVYAHGRGVAHCDIKPSNILLTSDGSVKLTDWGLARSGPSRWSVSGFSPRYAAPEQHQQAPNCGYGTDIWEIGMVFSELLTGNATIPSGKEPVFLEREGAELLRIIQKCLASSPGDRYLSAKALLEDLDMYIHR
jgi:hypothetical protein